MHIENKYPAAYEPLKMSASTYMIEIKPYTYIYVFCEVGNSQCKFRSLRFIDRSNKATIWKYTQIFKFVDGYIYFVYSKPYHKWHDSVSIVYINKCKYS